MSHAQDVFLSRRFGVFNHYLYGNPSDGAKELSARRPLDWNACVDSVDVRDLARRVHETGAGYYFLTLMQGSRYLLGPNAAYDSIAGTRPGEACSRRDLVGELICDPVTERGRFVGAYFDSEKTNLIDAIRSQINDKRDYAAARLLQEMCAGEPYGVSRLGDEKTAEKLQMKKLYAQYGELISTARLELFYIGSAQLERVRRALANAFATLPRDGIRDIAAAAPHPARAEVRTITEELDVTQGKLCMGFTCGSSDHTALLLGNTLFGGSSNSKLFLNVREKLSLCYYASSAYHRQKGLITVSSGIEFADYQRAYDEILRQLEAVQKGRLEDWEMGGARSTLLNAYASMGDSQGKLENFYLGQAATGQTESPEDLAAQLRDVTDERVFRAMETVGLDTVYFLKGKEAAE